ncbi:MAG: hypothetical protein HY865_00950 [Chloroflexi bacterium]|nr:hypothetical protein [Chloroflexota bacterium]
MTRKHFLALFAIAAIMRIALIWRAPLWYDENFTLILARLPFDRMIQATAGDVHPPLWYLIEWLLFHAVPALPVWAIRLPALVFSLLAFWLFGKLCILLQIPNRVFSIALLLMAILPMQLWYAQEGRMYAMLEFLVLAALYVGLTRRWTLCTLTAIAMDYTQNYGLIYCAVIAFVLVVMDWKQLSRVALAGVVTALAYAPWVLVTAGQMAEIKDRYWIVWDIDAGAALGILAKLFWASAMLEPGIVTSYVLTFAAIIIGVYTVARERHPAWWLVLTMAFVPVGIAWIVSVLLQPILIFRPLIGVAPFLYIIVAWSTFNLRPSTKLYASCFIVPIFMFGIAGYYVNIANMKGEGAAPMLGTLEYIRANWQDGDVIFYADDGPMVNISPYTDLPQYKMPACGARADFGTVLGSLSDQSRAAIGIPIANLEDVPHVRAWVYAPRSPLHPLCYEEQIKDIAPEGRQVITVDNNQYISSGVWLVEK